MSTTAEARYPDTDRQDAADGEAAHWGLAETLHGRVIAEGQIAPNGVILTEEMIEAAGIMYDDITRELAPYGMTPAHGLIEQQLPIPAIHAQSFGTPDYRVWLPTHGTPTLLLYDFKYGHRFVPAYENWQCVEYVSGVLHEAEVDGLQDQSIRVRVKIVQPRAFHRDGPVREWSFMASDIRAMVNIASAAAHEALGPNPVARTGPECRDCKARHACPTFQRAGYNAVDESSREQPFDLPPEALATELRIVSAALERLKARHDGLQQQALAMHRDGRKLPGWVLQFGAGRKRWTKPAPAIIAIGQMAGINLAKPASPITPTQAEAKGFPFEAFAGLVETPTGAATLVPDDGTRAARVFGIS